MSNKETIVALKSDEQASLSPGAYEVLTGAVERSGCTRESVDDALLIVGSYGQWGPDLNDAHRRQIVLADEVKILREALRKLLDMDPAYRRGPKVEEAVEAAWVALGPNVTSTTPLSNNTRSVE